MTSHNLLKPMLTLLTLTFLLSANAWGGANKPKYIFLFIGSGMGNSQVMATQMYLNSRPLDQSPKMDKKLNFTQFPIATMTLTSSASSFIADTAAAGTALATGMKTTNGFISQSPDGQTLYPSITTAATKAGMKTGLVSSLALDHAIPAVFYAHGDKPASYYKIAEQMLTSGINYFGGGGLLGNMPEERHKKEDLFKRLTAAGYRVERGEAGMKNLTAGMDKVYLAADMIDDRGALLSAIDRKALGKGMKLADFTRKGIELLNQPKGFLLVVAGGKIGRLCNANDGASMVQEVLDFDDAINEALTFAKEHTAETLILVTAEHETGGLSVGFSATQLRTYLHRLSGQKISEAEFEKVVKQKMDKKRRRMSIEEMLPLIVRYFGLLEVSFEERTDLAAKARKGDKEALERYSTLINPYDKGRIEPALIEASNANRVPDTVEKIGFRLYGKYNPFAILTTRLLNEKAGLGWTSYDPTATPVTTYATGASSEDFAGGIIDNTDIAKVLMKLLPAAN